MTTTVTLANLPSTPSDVAVNFFDQSKFMLRSTNVSADGNTLTSTYVLNDGAPEDETLAVLTSRVDPKSGIVYHTIRVTTGQVVTVDSLDEEKSTVSVTIGIAVPGPMEDATKVLNLIGSTYSLWFNGVTTKVPQSGNIGLFNRWLNGQLFG